MLRREALSYMATRTYWPFKGFFLKPYDEKYGTHLYQDYLKELAENPITEKEKRMRHESTLAAIAEMDRSYEEALQKEAAEREARCEEPDSAWEMWEWMEADPEPEEQPTQEAAEQQDDAPAEGQCTEAMVTADPNRRARISELIKDDYKDWHGGMRIVFDAGTNSGKTYFILNILLPWAKKKHRKILYLCNRSALRDQIRRDVEKLGRNDVICWDYDFESDQSIAVTETVNEYEGTIQVENYQWLESFYTGNPDGARDYLGGFSYVVADEYHYQLTDPVINDDIDVSYKLLNKWTESKVVIFMSATAHPFFDHWKNTGEVLDENYYYIPPDYRYISRVVFYWTDDKELAVIRQEVQHGKVLVFADSVRHIEKIRGVLEAEFPGEIATACSEYRPEAKDFDGVTAVLQDEKLCKRISLVTTVLYNGINIKDPELKCIISRLWDATVNAQILGRKRPLSADDTCAVYFKGYSHDWIKKERDRIRKYQLEPAGQWRKQETGQEEEWQEYLHKTGIVERLDKQCKTIHRDRYGNGWVWHRRAELQYRVQMDTLKKMMDDGYQHGLLKEISEPLVRQMEPLRFQEMEDYIDEHLGEEMLGEVMKEQIVKLGHIDNPANRHKNKKGVTLITINRRLKECYHAEITSRQVRINTTERAMLWTLCKL